MNFRPLGDLILVLPDPEPERHYGSLHLPDGAVAPSHQAGDSASTHFGTVVAVGPGDRHKPVGSFYCSECHQKPKPDGGGLLACGCWEWWPTAVKRWNEGRHVMLTKAGDRVVYPRRPNSPVGTDEGTGETGVRIGGVLYLLFHEEQSGFAVVE